jgi:hypothetical protein
MAMSEENGTTPELEYEETHRALNIQDDERMPPQPELEQQPQVPGHVAINVTPQGMLLQITPQPINLMIDENGMNQMVAQWLAAHTYLFDELVKQRLAQKQTELAIIRDIRSTKLN